MWSVTLSLFVASQARRNDYPAEALDNQITSLPGLSSDDIKNYNMFSGYIDVDEAHNRSLFYWFVESLNDPKTDPVALWTNGGPGCSGLGGFFTEQGPFRPKEDLSLYINNFSWVNAANMLFIEAPAGVGFSFSDDTADYTTNDSRTAEDNYKLIKGWLSEYPNYQNNSFYITSESYGGHYMPTLAKAIVEGNAAGGSPQINFKGFFVGNPYTDPEENEKGQYDTWFGHQLVSQPSWKKWFEECQDGADTTKALCLAAREQLSVEVGDNIDPYALDFPVCNTVTGPSAGKITERVWFMKQVIKDALKRPVPGIYRKLVDQLEMDLAERRRLRAEDEEGALSEGFPTTPYYPCEEDWMTEYLNRKDVQQAIHAKSTVWLMCADQVDYSIESMQTPMEPTYDWLIENGDGLKITIVSGDDDSVCGTLGTQSWIWNMNYTVSSDYNWKQWTDSEGQVGGFVTKFEDAFNFVTVHSAGHMIPETQPARSLEAFKAYLAGDI